MKCVSVQLYPALDTTFEVGDLLALVRSIGRFPEVDQDDVDPKSINLNFFTEDLQGFWQQFQQGVLNDPELGAWVKRIAVIVCEGDQGWDNYLLLWHHDQSQDTDDL